VLHRLLVEPFEAAYMQRALLEVVLLGVLGGVVGVHVVLRRMAFITEMIQHAVFPGIAVAFAFGWSLAAGALVSGLAAVALLAGTTRRRADPDAVMALLIATFFAAGVVVVSRRPGYQSDLTALLFGRILTVDASEIVETAVVAAVSVVVLVALHKELVLRAFDPMGAEALGYRLVRLDLLLDVIVTLTVVAAVRAVGTVLVVAFIVTPAVAARLVCGRVSSTMVVAAALGAVCGWLGLVVSYEGSVHHGWRLASGATVVLVMTLAFLVTLGSVALARRAGRRRAAPRLEAVAP
jgi:manganese/iron transport system permease protein